MKIKLKKIRETAKLPVKGKEGDFCYDVWATTEEEVAPNVWMYGLGFKYEIERDEQYNPFFGFNIFEKRNVLDKYDVCITARPRSSIWKTGMVLVNGPGTLDELYRGEAKAVFYHVLPNMRRYHVGDKVCQIHASVAPKIEFEFVDEINAREELIN